MANNITDADFPKDVLESDVPVLVDFWAEWCGPCRQIMPIIEGISEDYAGKLKVVKINIDENTETPMKYGVRGIPTLVIFKEGKVVSTKVGSLPKSTLHEWVNGIVNEEK